LDRAETNFSPSVFDRTRQDLVPLSFLLLNPANRSPLNQANDQVRLWREGKMVPGRSWLRAKKKEIAEDRLGTVVVEIGLMKISAVRTVPFPSVWRRRGVQRRNRLGCLAFLSLPLFSPRFRRPKTAWAQTPNPAVRGDVKTVQSCRWRSVSFRHRVTQGPLANGARRPRPKKATSCDHTFLLLNG